MAKRRKSGAAVVGEVGLRGFYSRLPVPERIVCVRCGEERNSVGQVDGICLKCRWEARRAAREAST